MVSVEGISWDPLLVPPPQEVLGVKKTDRRREGRCAKKKKKTKNMVHRL